MKKETIQKEAVQKEAIQKEAIQPVRVFIADDDALVRTAVRAILSADKTISIIGEATDGKEALAAVKELRPQVLVLDQNMPQATGMSTLRELAASQQGLRTLFLTVFLGPRDVLQTLILGGHGVVLKQDAQTQLLEAIQAVHKGLYWYRAKAYKSAQELVHALSHAAAVADSKAESALANMSPREKTILEMLSAGSPNKEIAYELHTSEQVVKNAVRRLFGKFSVDNRVELALYAVNHGLVGKTPPA